MIKIGVPLEQLGGANPPPLPPRPPIKRQPRLPRKKEKKNGG